jgi:hypothetical protein
MDGFREVEEDILDVMYAKFPNKVDDNVEDYMQNWDMCR